MNKYDIISASAAICVALVFFIIFTINKTDGKNVAVYVDNTLMATFDINDEISETIETKDGKGSLILKISNNEVSVTESDCNNQICVNTKAISKTGESIVCLPQKIVISITEGDKSEFDGFTN